MWIIAHKLLPDRLRVYLHNFNCASYQYGCVKVRHAALDTDNCYPAFTVRHASQCTSSLFWQLKTSCLKLHWSNGFQLLHNNCVFSRGRSSLVKLWLLCCSLTGDSSSCKLQLRFLPFRSIASVPQRRQWRVFVCVCTRNCHRLTFHLWWRALTEHLTQPSQ